MARKIDIEYNSKKYIIEYNRGALFDLAQNGGFKDGVEPNFDTIVQIIKYGLLKNHKDNMPTDDEIKELLFDLDDIEGFVSELGKCISETTNALKEKQGNAKWEVRN